jgi:ATP:ADP antiporter, AAA family
MKRLGVHVDARAAPDHRSPRLRRTRDRRSLVTLFDLPGSVQRGAARAHAPGARDAVHRREREDKYKSKAFIDTFVYRGGDVVGAQVEGLLGRPRDGPPTQLPILKERRKRAGCATSA